MAEAVPDDPDARGHQLLHDAATERAERESQRYLPSPEADGVAQCAVDARAHQSQSAVIANSVSSQGAQAVLRVRVADAFVEQSDVVDRSLRLELVNLAANSLCHRQSDRRASERRATARDWAR